MWNLRKRRGNSRTNTANAAVADCVQGLEDRALLTGNVQASLSGSNLSVSGDAADNQLELTVINNQVILRGLTDTTINGSADIFVVADATDTAPGPVSIYMGAGNDSMVISRNVIVAGDVWLDGGDGNDALSVTGATFRRELNIYGRTGNDTISVQNATTEGLLRIKGKQGDDLISLTNLIANGEMRIVGGSGADGVSFNNVTTAARTNINTGKGDDNIAITKSTINGELRIRAKQDSDMLTMDGSTVNGPVAINMGSRDDGVQLKNTNTFNSSFHLQAGDGHSDAVDLGTATVFNGGFRVRKSEGSTVNPTLTDRIDNATTGLIAKAAAADTAASALIKMTLTIDTSANTTESSVGGVLITRDSNFVISGTTMPGATVTLDTDNDGNFDNGTLTADSSGDFTTNVTLLRTDFNTATPEDDQLNGLNNIKVRTTVAGVGTKDAAVDVDFVPATDKIVRFTTNEGTYEVEMFNALTPNTVANFLTYEARYTNAIVQRSETTVADQTLNTPARPFVIQAGGFTENSQQISSITINNTTLVNEFTSAASNIRGTLSMALSGSGNNDAHKNSGTSQWFINLANNNGEALLDNNGQPVTNSNGPVTGPNLDAAFHTVFGRVIGNGMTVVDKIAALTTNDLSTATGIGDSTNGPLNHVPLRVPFTELNKALTGKVSATAGSTTITGVGTNFLTELRGQITPVPPSTSSASGSRIQINGETLRVASIESATSLTLVAAPTTTSSAQTAHTDDFADDNFVRFSSIAEILSI